MYFTYELHIDPSQATQIKRLEPKNIFGKLFRYLSRNSKSQFEEHESFSAINVLQLIESVLALLGINNIIRLSKDKKDFYFDKSGTQNDREKVFDDFDTLDEEEKNIFSNLFLVLEHSLDHMEYLIEVQINRNHPIGVYPIVIYVNGFSSLFEVSVEDDSQILKEKMKEEAFISQGAYDLFVAEMEQKFIEFVTKIENLLREYIGLDDLRNIFHKNIIKPREVVRHWEQIPFFEDIASLEPIFHGFHGYDRMLFHLWWWSILCFENKIEVKDCLIVNERGGKLMDLSNKTLDAKVYHALEPGIDFTLLTAHEQPAHGEEVFTFSSLIFDETEFLKLKKEEKDSLTE
jgi:hypothetical protein